MLWLVEELGFDCTIQHHDRVNHMAPKSLKDVSPTGSAPVFVTADGRTIIESTAIINYILHTYDTDKKFGGMPSPDDPKCDWVREEELQSFACTSLGFMVQFTFITQLVINMTPWFLRPVVRFINAPVLKMMIIPRIKQQVSLLDKYLGEEKWFSGRAEPGRADFVLGFPMDMLVHRKFVDIEMWPNLEAWVKRVEARPAWKKGVEVTNGYDWSGELFWSWTVSPGFC